MREVDGPMDGTSRQDPEQLLADARAGRRDSLGTLLEIYRSYLHALGHEKEERWSAYLEELAAKGLSRD